MFCNKFILELLIVYMDTTDRTTKYGRASVWWQSAVYINIMLDAWASRRVAQGWCHLLPMNFQRCFLLHIIKLNIANAVYSIHPVLFISMINCITLFRITSLVFDLKSFSLIICCTPARKMYDFCSSWKNLCGRQCVVDLEW